MPDGAQEVRKQPLQKKTWFLGRHYRLHAPVARLRALQKEELNGQSAARRRSEEKKILNIETKALREVILSRCTADRERARTQIFARLWEAFT